MDLSAYLNASFDRVENRYTLESESAQVHRFMGVQSGVILAKQL